MNATETTIADELAQAHAVLMKDLRALRRDAQDASRGQPGPSKARLQEVLNHIAKHFEFEERNGYMLEVLRRKPNLQRDVDHLRQDHLLLKTALEELIAAADPATSRGKEWPKQIEAWIAEVWRHEMKENDLVQDAFNLDIDAED